MTLRTIWRKSMKRGNATPLTGVCAIFTVSVLFFILAISVYNGGKSLSWAFFTQLPTPVGETGGGMANAIVGSAKLLLLAALIGFPSASSAACTSLSLGAHSAVYRPLYGGPAERGPFHRHRHFCLCRNRFCDPIIFPPGPAAWPWAS
jgi:hypothetical protein